MEKIINNIEKIRNKLTDEELKKIYYKYFYKNYDDFFKTSVLFTNVYKILVKNKELFDFLDRFNQYQEISEINIPKEEITKYKLTFNNLEEKYIKSFAIFIIILEKIEKKEFFFNGFNEYKINLNLNFLIDYYKQKNYDLKLEEEFSKYNLIEINEHRKLHWQEPRILDEKYEITFDIKRIDIQIYKKILDLRKLYDFRLSFYPNCLNIKNYIDNTIMIFDEKEYGKKYNFKDIKEVNLKENIKFVDYKIENKLYVKLLENELTFEEIQKILILLMIQILYIQK